jgi:hypothetical protein
MAICRATLKRELSPKHSKLISALALQLLPVPWLVNFGQCGATSLGQSLPFAFEHAFKSAC